MAALERTKTMHYRNGREAKVGDPVVKRTQSGTLEVGIVIQLNPGSTQCNIAVAQYHVYPAGLSSAQQMQQGTVVATDSEGKSNIITPFQNACQNSVEWMHAEDLFKAFEKLEGQIVADMPALANATA